MGNYLLYRDKRVASTGALTAAARSDQDEEFAVADFERHAIDDRVAKAPPLARQGEMLKAKLTALEEDLYQTRARAGQDLLNYPIRLTNRMSALRSSVEGGDARPTDASAVVFRELSAELDQKLAQLQSILTGDLAAFNRALAGRNIATIPPSAP